MRKFTSLLIALALSLAMGSAFAQTTPTLTFRGDVMVSTNSGEFVTAANGQTVVAGQSIMVPPGGSASLRYADGTIATFGAGTHTVPATGVVVGTSSIAASAGVTVGIVAGVVALAALAMDQNLDDDDEVPPVSP